MTAIDEIKQRVDIVDVISGCVPGLKKAGRNFKAPCPFHPERIPSFYVFPERQSWHCFGACATGGDVFSFVMKKEGADFAEALRILAQRAGVTLAAPYRDESKRQEDRLKEINEAAAEYYHRMLLGSKAGERARSYLVRRGVSDETVEHFQLGYSLDSWEAVTQELVNRKGYRHEEILAAGLLVEKDTGRTHDRFRNRLMFPIRGVDGRVVGFGARALDDSLPKYLNSPQTPIFDKSGSLYGIERARAAIRKNDMVIVVEGYMDAIVAHQHGFDNVVASLGTALTERQVGVVKKLTKNLTLALDADAAGEMATLRGIGVASHTFDQKVMPLPTPSGLIRYESLLDAQIRVMVLPQGKDPDDIVRESPDEWGRLLDEAMPVIDYTFAMVTSKVDLTDVKGKSEAVDQLLPLVAEIKQPVTQAHYLQKLSRMVGVDEQSLSSTLRKLVGQDRGTRKASKVQPSASIPSLVPGDPLAEYCLILLVRFTGLREHAAGLSPDLFPHSENRQLFLAWRDAADIDSVRASLGKPLQEYLDSLAAKPLPEMSEDEQIDSLNDCARRMQERWLKDLKAKEEALLADLQAEGSTAELEELQHLGVVRNSQLHEIFLHGKKRKVTPETR